MSHDIMLAKGRGRQHMNYTYIVKCNDGSLYTGWTNDLEKRMEAHNSGQGAKYTRGRSPVELVYFEVYDTKEEAMSREWHIKRLSRVQKLELIGKKG
jgi:putative endonuclease